MTASADPMSLDGLRQYRAEVRRLRDALGWRERQRRAAIALAVQEGLSFSAIAEAAGVSEATVYRIARASRDAAG